MQVLLATLRDLVNARVTSTSDHPVLVDPTSDRHLTYGDLARLAAHLVGSTEDHLQDSRGRIGIAFDDSYAAAEVFFAGIHARLAMVPLNLEAGQSHLSTIADQAGLCAIVVADHLVADVRQWSGATPLIPRSALPAGPSRCLPESSETGESFILYTSGSTGVPKGVILSHGNSNAMGHNNRNGYEWTARDRILCPLPFWHMNACDKALGVMASGATMIVPPRFQVGEFWTWTIEQRPTAMIIVPTIASELLHHDIPDDPRFAAALEGVRYAGSSSAPLNGAVHDDFVSRFGIPMIEAFGMSETGTIFVTPPPPAVKTPGSVGQPAGWETRVTGPDGAPLPVGEAGALELRGPALTIGYDDDDVFATAVSPDGWFSTGDIGHFNDMGEFFVLGRAKEIVIKGGVNIAPREIDEVVSRHPHVMEVGTVGVPDNLLGEDLESFVVLRPDAQPDRVITELTELCRDKLGVLKTPRRISAIDALPKGPAGKVQPLRLRELASPGHSTAPGARRASGRTGDRTAPATPIEELVHGMWSQLLGRGDLGTHENFFEAGGYSLLALETCIDLRARLSLDVSVSTLFENPTVASFAEVVAAATWLRTNDEAAPAFPVGIPVQDVAGQIGAMTAAARSELESALLRARRDDIHASVRTSAILLNSVDLDARTTLPLFCPYGPYQYREIADHLAAADPPTPTYGLFSEGEFDDRSNDQLNVSELARRYVVAMRDCQPEGPYHLLGFSFGGRIALEMATQLQSDGHEVALLAPVDTYLDTLKPIWHPVMIYRSVRAAIGRRRHGHPPEKTAQTVPSSAFADELRSSQARARRRSSLNHETPRYRGTVHLARAARVHGGAMARSQNRWLGWERACEDVRVITLDGTHHDLVHDPLAGKVASLVHPLVTRPRVDRPQRRRVYVHPLIDSRRWDHYEPRDGDVIISTSMKAGTTWTQRIVGMILSGSADPVDLSVVSPWIESSSDDPAEVIFERLANQPGRRFLKSHLPSDALPWSDDVNYIVVGRDTRDVFLSMHGHYRNLKPDVIRILNEIAEQASLPDHLRLGTAPDDAMDLWSRWISTGSFPWERDGAPFWSHHYHATSFWRWRHLPNILFVHYDDLLADLPTEIRRIAAFLGVDVSDDAVTTYADAASFRSMKANGAHLLAQLGGALSGGSDAFFRKGTTSQWTEIFNPADLELYERNASALLAPELKTWLENGRHAIELD